jgi:hypothetical protein
MGLTSGTRLGPHEIQSPSGAGGIGGVYRARDTRLDRSVAVKILPSHFLENSEAKQRLDREPLLVVVTDENGLDRIELRPLAPSEVKLVLDDAGRPTPSRRGPIERG